MQVRCLNMPKCQHDRRAVDTWKHFGQSNGIAFLIRCFHCSCSTPRDGVIILFLDSCLRVSWPTVPRHARNIRLYQTTHGTQMVNQTKATVEHFRCRYVSR
jgi:hypothetical protein